jgi:hypothetical protein
MNVSKSSNENVVGDRALWPDVRLARGLCDEHHRGEAVQVDPFNTTLKAPVSKSLKLKHDNLLSNVAFKLNLRRYIAVCLVGVQILLSLAQCAGRGSHSSTFQLNLSRLSHTSPCPPV